MLRASATEGTGKELGEFFKRIFFISSISWTRDDYDYDKDDDDDDDDHNVGISHKYFKIGLVACGPCFLFRCAVASLYEVVSVRPSVRRSVGP